MARILLVDDDSDIRLLGTALLQRAGHDAFAVGGAMEALDYLRANRVDVLVTDANMPEHSGFELLKTVKMDPSFPREMSLVMLTGRRERKDIERAVTYGAHDYIVKPLDPELFLQKITDLLARRPSAEKPPLEFASLKLKAPAVAGFEIVIESLSELGLVVNTPFQFPEATQLKIQTPLFAQIGIPDPVLRVLSSIEKEDSWESKVAFVGADERSLTKIRAWIHSQTIKNRAAA